MTGVHCLKRVSLLLLALVLGVSAAQAQLPLTGAYTQDFNTLASIGSSSALPAGWLLNETGTSAAVDGKYTANNGSLNTGDTYSYGSTGSTERALGTLLSGTLTPTIGACFVNNTGVAIQTLTIAYNGEQWRLGQAGRGSDHLDFSYRLSGTDITTGSWTSVPALNFTSPISTGTVGALDGNAAANRTAVSSTINGLSIANGQNFCVRWTDFNITGSDDGLAVDDFSLTPTGGGSTNPSAIGTANPSTVIPGTSTTLSATVTGGSNPDSTGIAVSCDLTAIGGSSSFSLPLLTGSTYSASYSVPMSTVPQMYTLACTVTDGQGRSGSFNIVVTVTQPFMCEAGTKTSTPVHTIQGSGATSSMSGQVVDVEGIVVGDFQAATQLKGFYLQEPDATWDADPTTSEGIFIFDNATGADVNIGDRVRVRGTVNEFTSSGSFLGTTKNSTQTEIESVQAKLVCSTGNSFTRTTLSLPIANLTDFERYEGMAVQFTQTLTVTGNFSLGTFGQLDLSPSVLYAPTDLSADPSTWPVQTSLNTRSVIALDDGSTLANASLYPTLFPQGGLSASNTLRVGALVNYDSVTHSTAPLVGILDDRFGEYRIQPTAAVTFYNANSRPAIAPILSSVGGRFRASSANVLNFFTTLGSRGAQTSTEFDHQKTKVIEALAGMDADVYGLSEVQNFANGGTSGGTYTNAALQSLVDGLNCKKAGSAPTCTNPPSMPFGLIDTLPLGTANGTDAIRTAIIYRLDRLIPVGSPAMYYQQDTNRPTLAQTFQPASGAKAASQTFTFVVNHFRSKGSACGGASDDLYQGNCNGLRLNMAQNVVTWLAGNPTNDPAGVNRKLLMVGDFNAYYGEDPIQYIDAHGYTNLIAGIIGGGAYSYNFGSQAGYLDHALANPVMNLLVKSVAEWHNNADEPSSLQALNSVDKSAAAQVAYYGADPYAASDHDPIVIGFNPLPGDLNDDGVVDAADQKLMTAAVGKKASAVDRRMDYDGDGQITLNDYRIWTNYYRAYIQ